MQNNAFSQAFELIADARQFPALVLSGLQYRTSPPAGDAVGVLSGLSAVGEDLVTFTLSTDCAAAGTAADNGLVSINQQLEVVVGIQVTNAQLSICVSGADAAVASCAMPD